MGAGKLLWGWYPTDKVWLPLQVDANGKVKVDMSAINLNDLGDVNVPAPGRFMFLLWDTASSLWICDWLLDGDIPDTIARDAEVADAILAHAGLTTGVHGAGPYTLLHSGAAVRCLAKAYLGSNQEVVTTRNCTIQLDTVAFDLESCWQTGDWYGAPGAYRQADADSDATHIEDDDANFPRAVLGSKVYTASNAAGTLNTGIYYVSQTPAPSPTTLTVQKLSGVDFAANYYYWFQKRHYVAPVTGYYPCFFQEQYLLGVEADKRYGIYIFVNGVQTIAALFHASIADMMRLPHNGVLELTAGDIVSMHSFTDAVGNPTMGKGIGNTVMTIYCLQEA